MSILKLQTLVNEQTVFAVKKTLAENVKLKNSRSW